MLPRLLFQAFSEIKAEEFYQIAVAAAALGDAVAEDAAMREYLGWKWAQPPSLIEFGPFALFMVGVLGYSWLPPSTANAPHTFLSRPIERENQVLAVNYSMDEAFSILSVLVLGSSIIQQVIYAVQYLVAGTIRKSRVVGIALGISGVCFILVLISPGIVFVALWIGNVVGVDAGYLGDVGAAAEDFVGTLAKNFFVVTLLLLAVLVFLSSVIFILVGVFRALVLLVVGVLPPIRSRADLGQAIFGSVTVSQAPAGRSLVITVSDMRWFSHTAIHSDTRVIQAILAFIKE